MGENSVTRSRYTQCDRMSSSFTGRGWLGAPHRSRAKYINKKCGMWFEKIVLRVRGLRSTITCLLRFTDDRDVTFANASLGTEPPKGQSEVHKQKMQYLCNITRDVKIELNPKVNLYQRFFISSFSVLFNMDSNRRTIMWSNGNVTGLYVYNWIALV